MLSRGWGKPPRLIQGLWVWVALTATCTPALGQTPTADSSARLETGLRAASFAGSNRLLWGGAGLVGLSGRISLGGAGWLLAGSAPLGSAGAGSDLELKLGYGGAVVDVTLLATGSSRIAARLLLGAGNAKVLVPVVGPELGADNFGVIEPEVLAVRRLAGPLALSVGVSYRRSFAVEDLLQVMAEDLSGTSVSLSLALGTR